MEGGFAPAKWPVFLPRVAKSNDSRQSVRKSDATDPRVERTTRALGRALIELIQERDYDEITVQSILDRSRVSRASFYAHYRNKEDVLQSQYEGMFAGFERHLHLSSPGGSRLFPVAEFAAHVAEVGPLMSGLRASGRDTDLWQTAVDYAAAIIEKRLGDSAASQGRLSSRMLAGALIESLQWWLDHPASANPAVLDQAFHRLALGLGKPL